MLPILWELQVNMVMQGVVKHERELHAQAITYNSFVSTFSVRVFRALLHVSTLSFDV